MSVELDAAGGRLLRFPVSRRAALQVTGTEDHRLRQPFKVIIRGWASGRPSLTSLIDARVPVQLDLLGRTGQWHITKRNVSLTLGIEIGRENRAI